MKILFLALLFITHSYASDILKNEEKIATIEISKTQLNILKKQIKDTEEKLKGKLQETEKTFLSKHLEKLKTRFNNTKVNLISSLTDIKMEEEVSLEPKKRDYIEEAQSLLGPAIDTIQRISARPRKIESIKNEINYHQEKLNIINQSLEYLDLLNTSDDFASLKKDFETSIEESKYQLNEAKNSTLIKIEGLENKLNDLNKDKVSLMQASTGFIKSFLATKGKNILISLSIFIFTIWTLFKFREKVIFKFLEKKPDQWYVKPVSAFYGFIAIITSLSLSMIALYLLGDWVLVTLTILILSAAIWTSKNYIPKYLTEFKLILNFGTIKEGELVIYAGLPWKVQSIGFVTIFENEYLDSKQIRIQISEITKMHSRKILNNEQWFPTKTFDWVLLSDGTFGQVLNQTLEQVAIQTNKTSIKYIPTLAYLALNPTNLSKSFTLTQDWSFDYKDQKFLLDQIVPELKIFLKNSFAQSEFKFAEVDAGFSKATANSLDIVAWVDVPGSQADKYYAIKRHLNESLLKFNTNKNLNIPFPQMDVHLNQQQ